MVIDCDRCREALSAQLDGEETAADRDRIARHLPVCADCRRWVDDAAAVTRLARIGLDAASPGVDDRVLDAMPVRRRRWRLVSVLRVLLGVTAVVQVGVGVLALTHAGQAVTGHLSHEAAAWNIAVGVAFGWVAAGRSQPSATMAVLTPFTVVLATVEILDLSAGRIDADRLLLHAVLIAGYLLLVVLIRSERPGVAARHP